MTTGGRGGGDGDCQNPSNVRNWEGLPFHFLTNKIPIQVHACKRCRLILLSIGYGTASIALQSEFELG